MRLFYRLLHRKSIVIGGGIRVTERAGFVLIGQDQFNFDCIIGFIVCLTGGFLVFFLFVLGFEGRIFCRRWAREMEGIFVMCSVGLVVFAFLHMGNGRKQGYMAVGTIAGIYLLYDFKFFFLCV